MSEELDLWAAENQPHVQYASTTYRISLPPERRAEVKTSQIPFVYVQVDEYGMIDIERDRTRWVGRQEITYQTCREIYEWLTEWELAEWIRIGPEDRELFATAKLVGDETYNALRK